MEIVRLLRLHQWLKNIFVFAPIFFVGDFFIFDKFFPTAIAAISFSFASSAAYILNDIFDRREDAQHPVKCQRPIASGTVSVVRAKFVLVFIVLLLTASLAFSVPPVRGIILLYVGLNVAYSLRLKHIPIFDLLTISFFFLLRILTGGLASQTGISSWLILCTIFIACFLTIGKRRGELQREHHRPVLRWYSEQFLDQLLMISATLTIVSYGIYTVLVVHSTLAVYSLFFVLFGMFRYLLLLQGSEKAEYPERLIFDRGVLGSIIGWLCFMVLIFYRSIL